MGFLEFVNPQIGNNPFYKAFDANRNTLSGFGAGLIDARDMPSAFQGAVGNSMQGRQMDTAYATQKKAEAEQQRQIQEAANQRNLTIDYLNKNFPDLAAKVQAGMPVADAWKQTFAQASGPEYKTVGDTLLQLGPDGVTPVYTAPQAPPKPTSGIQEYEYAKSQGYKGSFQDFELEQRKAGATNIDFNANQGTAAAYADRMTSANQILNDPKIIAAQVDVTEAGKSALPGVGNFLTSNERKMAEQAQRDFINAILRRESGAVISPSEFENAAQQYFPQPGDTPDVIAQKARNREQAIQGVVRAAGPNYQQPTLTPGAGSVSDWQTYFGN